METTEAIIARKAMEAVVNISTWKMHPPDKVGEPARRMKTYASGFVVD
jgi:hypothetical protein